MGKIVINTIKKTLCFKQWFSVNTRYNNKEAAMKVGRKSWIGIFFFLGIFSLFHEVKVLVQFCPIFIDAKTGAQRY